jgi:hypothetical protein
MRREGCVVEADLVPAVRAAIQYNELGAASPYSLSYACLGASGASFGIFQGDTNVNHAARVALLQALQANGVAADACDRIIAAVSRPCPNGNPLSAGDTQLANAALAAPSGRALVDALDGGLLEIVLGEVDSSVAAAAAQSFTIDPAAQLYIALWVNMTGAPTTLNAWLGGSVELGLGPPEGPVVMQADLQMYLQGSVFFRLHPQNFIHMQSAVQVGAALLPGAEGALA